MSAPLSSPRLASTAWFPESSAPEDQAGGRTRAQWRSPHASGSAERLRTPAGSEEKGFFKGRGWSEEAGREDEVEVDPG